MSNISLISGTTPCGLLFRGNRSPYFGRGAVKSLKLLEPSDYKHEFKLISVEGVGSEQKETVVAISTGLEIIAVRDIPLEVRVKSFEASKLPYAEHGVGADEYVNLAAFHRLYVEWTVDDPAQWSQYADGFIEQCWSQLVRTYDEKFVDGLGAKGVRVPLVAFPLNLVPAEPEYIPPQIRQERVVQKLTANS